LPFAVASSQDKRTKRIGIVLTVTDDAPAEGGKPPILGHALSDVMRDDDSALR